MVLFADIRDRVERMEILSLALHSKFNGHPLQLEFDEHLHSAQASVDESISCIKSAAIEETYEDKMTDLMYAAYNLNRCQAIHDLLSDEGQVFLGSNQDELIGVIRLSRDRVFIRWLTSRASKLRSWVFGLNDYYRTPPLMEALLVYGVSRAAVSAKLKNVVRALKIK